MASPRLAALLGLAGGACVDADPDARRALVITTLAEDNQPWATRAPAALAGKYRRMQADTYAWLRGTAAVYWRDVTGPDAPGGPSAFAGSAAVLLVGDPHPENLGTFRAPDGAMLIDWNDLDAAGYGEFWLDVRRWVTACLVAVPIADPDAALDAARTIARAYADQATGARPPLGALGLGAHPWLDEVLAAARADGNRGARRDEDAPIDPATGRRRLARGELTAPVVPGVIDDERRDLGPERAAIAAVIATWREARPDAAALGPTLDVVRRFGAGVASYAAPRYYALLDGPSAAPSDDLVIELKEAAEAPTTGAPRFGQTAPWTTPAARTVWAQQALAARADGDPLLGAVASGTASFRIRGRGDYQRNLDVVELRRRALDEPAAWRELAALGGRLLAAAHGRAPAADGRAGAAVIAPLLAGRQAEFADETAAFAVAYAARVGDDAAALRDVDLVAARPR